MATNVDSSARTSPPRTRTAPISVISSVPGRVPLVSRSTTTNVTSESIGSSSSNAAWTPDGRAGTRVGGEGMPETVATRSDRAGVATRPTATAGGDVVPRPYGLSRAVDRGAVTNGQHAQDGV